MGGLDSLLGGSSDPSTGGSGGDLGGLDGSSMSDSLGGDEGSLDGLGGLGDSDMSGLSGDSSSDTALGGDMLGGGIGDGDMSSLLGDDSMGGGSDLSSMGGGDLSAMGGEGFGAAGSAEEEAENPCSCTHHLTECEISDQLVSLNEQERSATMTSMFAWACDQPSGCAYLNDPSQLLHCSDYQKLSWVYNEYYKAKGKTPESCNWSGYAQLTTPTEPTANCKTMLTTMGLLGGAADQGMTAATFPEGLGDDMLGAGGENLAMGGDFPSMDGSDLSSLGGDSGALGDELSSMGGDSGLGGGIGEELSSLGGSASDSGATDSMFGDLSADASSPLGGASEAGAGGAPSDDLASLMGDAGADLGGELPADAAGDASGGGRPQLAASAFKQKRDWRARRV